jgi:hypothetical protein
MKNRQFVKIFPGVLMLVLFLAVYGYIFDAKLDLNGDNANYYILGKALAGGHGYVNLNSPSQTVNNHFPPGYPAIIGVLIQIFGDSFNIPKLFNGALFLASLLILFFTGKALTNSTPVSILTVFAIMLNSHFLRFSTIIMSELPFIFCTLLAIYIFSRSKKEGWGLNDGKFYFTLALVAGAFYVRSSGMALIAGILFYLLMGRNWRLAFSYLSGFLVLIMPWIIRGQLLGGNSYLHQLVMVNPYRPAMGEIGLADLLSRVIQNLVRYITVEIPSASLSFIPVDYLAQTPLWLWLVGPGFLMITGYGLWQLPGLKSLVWYYILSTLGILLLWPEVWVGIRFVLPIVPFLMLGFFYALNLMLRKRIRHYKVIYWLPGLILAAYLLPLRSLHVQAVHPYDNAWLNYFELANYLKYNEDSQVTVACRKPALFHLYSHTYTLNYKYTEDQEVFIKDLQTKKIDYVVLEQLGYGTTLRYLYPVMRDQPHLFETVMHLDKPDTYLVKFLNNSY